MKKLLLVSILICCFLGSNFHVVAEETVEETTPTTTNANYNSQASHAVVYDVQDQRIIYDKGANDQIYPASMTKIMTSIVALDKIDDLDQEVVMSAEAFVGLKEANASMAGFKEGQVLTYRDLLAGTLLPSGAEASNQLALSLYGSVDKMVEAMNDKAEELGLEHTHFMNTTGLHDDNHYTTPYEMAKILEYALAQKELYSLLETDAYSTSDNSLTLKHTTTQMESDYDAPILYFEGGKTGFTLEAQYCLASFSTDEEERLIMVVQGLPSRSAVLPEVESLYKYIYENNDRIQVLKKGDKVGEISVLYSDDDTYPITSPKDYSYFLSNDAEVTVTFKAKKDLEAPIKKGQVIGTISIKVDDEVVEEIKVKATQKIERNNLKYYVHYFSVYADNNPLVIILNGATIMLLVIFVIYRRIMRKL